MILDVKLQILSKENVKKIGKIPGVYTFWNDKKTPLYVGKSVSLRSRLLSYLSLPVDTKTRSLLDDARYFSTIKVGTEWEALILEAKLVKLFYPKYNIELKDDKNPLYIVITKEKYPQILTSRRPTSEKSFTGVFGPFQSRRDASGILKVIRRIFPFATHPPAKRPCIYSQIGLCNPCPSQIEQEKDITVKLNMKRVYGKNIRRIRMILSGGMSRVLKGMIKEMKSYADNQNFEMAAVLKERIKKLENLTHPPTNPFEFIKNPNLLSDIRNKEEHDFEVLLKPFFKERAIKRIEAYDISHLAGTNPTASMVTFVNGEKEPGLYRRFRIRQKKGNDDISSLTEVAKRREKHLSDWGKPDLMLIDGGKAQVSVFYDIFKNYNIPVVGLAKRFETLVIPQYNEKEKFKLIKLDKDSGLFLMQRLRDEAHRFARSYHFKLTKKDLTGQLN